MFGRLLKRKIHKISLEEFLNAAKAGDLEIVQKYIKHHHNINATNDKGQTALMLAAAYYRTEIVKLLLSQPELAINTADNDGYTALICATIHRNNAAVTALLTHRNILINTRDNNGETALLHTCTQDFVGEMPDRNRGAKIAIMLLARPEIDVNADNNIGETPLFRAIANEQMQIIKPLLERADINVNIALRSDYHNWSILMNAIGDMDTTLLLLDKPDININYADSYGTTALMLAAAQNRIEFVLLLISHGANVLLKDKDGKTAAERTDNDAIMKVLREAGEKQNAYQPFGIKSPS